MNYKKDDPYQDNLSNMMGLDLYLNSIPENEYEAIKHKVRPQDFRFSPLLSWEHYIPCFWEQRVRGKVRQDQQALELLSRQHNWDIDFQSVLSNSYEALVLTDHDLVIQWVDKGFSKMTGYTAKDAIGRTPRFLQGQKTTAEARQRIRGKISTQQPFRERVVNYRKNRQEYTCDLHVFPLGTGPGVVTHYLALEREIA